MARASETVEVGAAHSAEAGFQAHGAITRESEDELIRSRALLSAVLECAPGFIMAIDGHGKLQFINRVLPQHDRKDVIGSFWLTYMPPDQHESLRAWFQAALETGASKTYETRVAGATGESIWLTTHMSPMRNGPSIVGVVLVAQEITELRHTQLEFAAAQRMAAVGTLAAGIAHEINTPVQFVGDSLQFLQEGMHDLLSVVNKLQEACRLAVLDSPTAATAAALEAASEAETAADLPFLRDNLPQAFTRCTDGLTRVASIVGSIREFAHPAQREMAPADLNRAISNTLTIARNEYVSVADLRTDFGDLPAVTCHVDQINQVVLNLVVNAAHAIKDVNGASGAKGQLGVRTRMDGDEVVIAVSDSGTGISEAIREHIFEPFFTTKEVGKGTGQGLALAWKVVTAAHGGKLSYETSIGKGTTFFVRLPAKGKPEVVK